MWNLFLILLLLLSSCHNNDCYLNNYSNITNYKVKITRHTPNGIALDDPGNLLDDEEIDRVVNEVEECLGRGVKKNCLIIKIPKDFYISPCSGKLLFPCNINKQICIDKGLEVSEECPCHCRSIIQDENYIITTPDLENFKGELVRMITGINNPWINEDVSMCL